MLQQNLVQKQEVKILPQQIQLLNLFHLNTIELEHRIEQELEDNPFLDQKPDDEESNADKLKDASVQDFQDWEEHGYDDIPDYKVEYSNYLHNNEDKIFSPARASIDFREDLKKQYRLCCTDEKEVVIADYMIDSLSDSGLLEIPLEKVAEEYSFSCKTWLEREDLEGILKNIQHLEPIGVGAQSICECL